MVVFHSYVGGLEHGFCFSIYWECHHPNWRTHIFQRDWNRQPEMDLNGYLVIWTMSKVRHKTWVLPNDSLEKWWKPPMFYYNWTLRQITGWWFGTWLLWLSIILGMSSSQLTNIFQRDRSATNQIKWDENVLVDDWWIIWSFNRDPNHQNMGIEVDITDDGRLGVSENGLYSKLYIYIYI